VQGVGMLAAIECPTVTTTPLMRIVRRQPD